MRELFEGGSNESQDSKILPWCWVRTYRWCVDPLTMKPARRRQYFLRHLEQRTETYGARIINTESRRYKKAQAPTSLTPHIQHSRAAWELPQDFVKGSSQGYLIVISIYHDSPSCDVKGLVMKGNVKTGISIGHATVENAQVWIQRLNSRVCFEVLQKFGTIENGIFPGASRCRLLCDAAISRGCFHRLGLVLHPGNQWPRSDLQQDRAFKRSFGRLPNQTSTGNNENCDDGTYSIWWLTAPGWSRRCLDHRWMLPSCWLSDSCFADREWLLILALTFLFVWIMQFGLILFSVYLYKSTPSFTFYKHTCFGNNYYLYVLEYNITRNCCEKALDNFSVHKCTST